MLNGSPSVLRLCEPMPPSEEPYLSKNRPSENVCNSTLAEKAYSEEEKLDDSTPFLAGRNLTVSGLKVAKPRLRSGYSVYTEYNKTNNHD